MHRPAPACPVPYYDVRYEDHLKIGGTGRDMHEAAMVRGRNDVQQERLRSLDELISQPWRAKMSK
jgi:hypothetical protein